MTTTYYDYNGLPIAQAAPINTALNATAAGQTLTATGVNYLLQDITGGDVLIGGSGSTNFYISDPATTVIQGAHTGVSSVSTWTSFTLPSGVDDLYAEGTNITATGFAGRENLIVADGSKDVLLGGTGGNDVLVDSGAGSDRFMFNPGGGHEVVYGFQTAGAAQDSLNLSAYGYTSFGQISPLLSQQGADTLLTLSSTDSILIRNTQVSALTASDFMLGVDFSKMTLTFDDEFNSLSLYNPATGQGTWKTSFTAANPIGAGSWTDRTIAVNNEQEIYVDPSYAGAAGGTTPLGVNPFSISNGGLTITATNTPSADLSALDNFKYTSGLLTTENSFAQTYGYFEIKAELPTGQGVWPAFWMLPENQVNADELDVMENLNGSSTVFQTAHWNPMSAPTQSSWDSVVAGLSSGFHTYGLLWTAQELVWYIDGKAVAEMATPATMNQPMYMMLNLAVGGDLPGAASSTFTSAQMQIDYVHAYSLTSAGGTTPTYTAASSTDLPTDTTVNTISSAFSYVMPTSFAQTLVLTGSANLTATGNDLGDHITGNTGNDTLIAGLGANVLDASQGGADLLNGAAGTDTLIGGAGNDTFIVGNSADVVTALAGHQNVLDTSVTFHTPDNIQTVTVTGNANVGIWANGTGDVITGNSGNDTFYSGAGNDSFAAGTGVDTFVAGAGMDTFWINNAADVIQGIPVGSKDIIQTTVSYHLLDNAAELVLTAAGLTGWSNGTGATLAASAAGDTLIGGAGNDSFISSTAGADTLIGGAGSDSYFVQNYADVITPGTGSSTVWSTVSYHLPDNVALAYLSAGSANLSLWAGAGAEHLYANSGNDALYAGSGADTLSAGAGADTLVGGSGADSLIAGTGLDTFVAGTGADTFVVNNAGDVIQGLVAGNQDVVQTSVSYALPDNLASAYLAPGSANLSLWAGAGAEHLYANSGNDALYSGSGVDTLSGGSGADTFVVNNSADVVIAGTGHPNVLDTTVSFQAPANIQTVAVLNGASVSVWANSAGDTMIASWGNDTFYGGAGNDSFVSGSGVDTFIAGAGADTFWIQNSADVIQGVQVGSHDLVQADVNYRLPDNVAQLSLTGSANLTGWSNNTGATLAANAGNDMLYGGAGNDSFISGAGIDTMAGGGGSDTYFVQNAADVITVGTGSSTVWADVSYQLPDNVQIGGLTGSANLTLWAGAGAEHLYANAGNDILYAGSGADTLNGGTGNDTLVGGAGADSFNTGTGLDTIIAGSGVDTFYIRNAGDVIQGVFAGSHDVVQSTVSYHLPDNVASLALTGSANLSGWSNSTGATLSANSGNDVLYGGAGNDSFVSGSGVDTMLGGGGNDSYFIQNSADVISIGSGQATVWSDVNYHLPDWVQVGGLVGSANLSLWAGAGNVQLYANAGNDALYAGSGMDTLAGGAGADTFVFGLGSGKDTITSFLNGSPDAVDISAYLNVGYTSSLAEVGGNAVISISNGETITLIGVQTTSLIASATGYHH